MGRSQLDEILRRLQELEEEFEMELERVLEEKRQLFQYHFEQGRVRFEQGIKALQRQQRVGVWSYLRNARLAHVLTVPVIYSLLLPFVVLDVSVTLYQHICFRIYGISLVCRSNYIVIDRHQLAYLNLLQKINCIYCGYINGLIEYMREIAARTEQYWCPIKHARRSTDPHRLSHSFADYGDAEAYYGRLKKLRQELKAQQNVDDN